SLWAHEGNLDLETFRSGCRYRSLRLASWRNRNSGSQVKQGGRMHKYIWILCVVGLLAPACARKVDVEQQKAALMEADQAWSQTTTDPEKLVSYFATDASLLPQGMPVAEGHDAIRQVIT